MIRTIIVDDEPLALKGLQNQLSSQQGIEIIATCSNGFEAIKDITTLKPDLVFLDIQMPELDGFQLIRNLQIPTLPLFIFVTAHDAFALEAFRVHALDYLLKPVKTAELQEALRRATPLLKTRREHDQEQRIQQLLTAIPEGQSYVSRLIVRGSNALEIVTVADILWLEAQGDYINLHTSRKTYLHRETLTALIDQLDPQKFCRVHRSAAVALHFVEKLLPLSGGDYEIQLQNGRRLSLSRTYRNTFLERLHG